MPPLKLPCHISVELSTNRDEQGDINLDQAEITTNVDKAQEHFSVVNTDNVITKLTNFHLLLQYYYSWLCVVWQS